MESLANNQSSVFEFSKHSLHPMGAALYRAFAKHLTVNGIPYADGSRVRDENVTITDFRKEQQHLLRMFLSGQNAMTNKTVKENMLKMLRQHLIQTCWANFESNRTECENSETIAFRFVFPFMLILSILGNSLALIVYRSKFLQNAPTVSLLALKAFANLLGVCFLSTEMIKHYNYDVTLNGQSSNVEHVYWYTRPYVLFFVNYFGTLAVWCTLVITLETFLCIARPVEFRKWSQKKNVYVLIMIVLILDCLHHVALPVTRTTEKYSLCYNTVQLYRMEIRNHSRYHTYERIYFYVQSAFVICIPNLLMLILCILIGVEFQSKTISHTFSHRRRCVLRITITTTVCYCVLETPGVFVYLVAAWRGSDFDPNHQSLCVVSVVTNFLSISNATVPFLVYVSFNDTFRHLLFVQLANLFGVSVAETHVERCCTNTTCHESGVIAGGHYAVPLMTRLASPSNGHLTNSREQLTSGV